MPDEGNNARKENTMDRPDKLQIARDVIGENLDLLAVMFIDQDIDLFWKFQAEINDKIRDLIARDESERRDLTPTKNELGLK